MSPGEAQGRPHEEDGTSALQRPGSQVESTASTRQADDDAPDDVRAAYLQLATASPLLVSILREQAVSAALDDCLAGIALNVGGQP